MSVDKARRLALHDAAAHNRWTAEAALTLMEMLPPSGWSDVVRRSDLDALETRIRLELRADLADLQRRTIQWNVGTLIALAGVATAIAHLT